MNSYEGIDPNWTWGELEDYAHYLEDKIQDLSLEVANCDLLLKQYSKLREKMTYLVVNEGYGDDAADTWWKETLVDLVREVSDLGSGI